MHSTTKLSANKERCSATSLLILPKSDRQLYFRGISVITETMLSCCEHNRWKGGVSFPFWRPLAWLKNRTKYVLIAMQWQILIIMYIITLFNTASQSLWRNDKNIKFDKLFQFKRARERVNSHRNAGCKECHTSLTLSKHGEGWGIDLSTPNPQLSWNECFFLTEISGVSASFHWWLYNITCCIIGLHKIDITFGNFIQKRLLVAHWGPVYKLRLTLIAP